MAWYGIWYNDGSREVIEKADVRELAKYLVGRKAWGFNRLAAHNASEAFREMWGEREKACSRQSNH